MSSLLSSPTTPKSSSFRLQEEKRKFLDVIKQHHGSENAVSKGGAQHLTIDNSHLILN